MSDWFDIDNLIESWQNSSALQDAENLGSMYQSGAWAAPATDWSDIDKMIQELGTKAGEAENRGTAASVREQMTLLQKLKEIGVPTALLAGLFEKNENPLTPTLARAANSAMTSADAFGGMSPVGMQPSSQNAIDLANSSTGSWKPYVDQASTYTDQAAGGVPSINLSTYMNPYLDNALSSSIRKTEEGATRRRQQLRHQAVATGNDAYGTGTEPTRYGVESSLIDREALSTIGDLSTNAYKGAFNTATGLATTDLNRKGQAGGAFNTMAGTAGTQNARDFTTLGAAGELEAKPLENALTHKADSSKLYTSVIPGTSSAVTATNRPSVLGQAAGAFGAYNKATAPGGILEGYKP